jgi:hypothetical protein
MKVKARNGKVYDVASAPPAGSHAVHLDGTLVGSFVLLDQETRVTVKSTLVNEALLTDIADRFVDMGGGPMGIA